MTAANNEFTLTVEEAKLILGWGEFVMETMGEIDGAEEDLWLRIRDWTHQ